MKVILIKDVARLGRKSEVREVPDGHALNFLIPRKLALAATPENMKRLQEVIKQHETGKEESLQSFKDAVKALEMRTVSYEAEANEKGSLFKGIRAEDISAHLASVGIVLGSQMFLLDHPIKSVGIHEVPIRYGINSGVCRLEVVKK